MLNRLLSSIKPAAAAFIRTWRDKQPVKVVISPELQAHTKVDISPRPEAGATSAPAYEVAASYRGKLIRVVADPEKIAAGKQTKNGVQLRPQYRLGEVRVEEKDLRTEFTHGSYPRFQVCLILVYTPSGPDADSLFGFEKFFSFHQKN